MDNIATEFIEHRVLIRTDQDRVYTTLTTAEGWDSWFTKGAFVDPRSGGSIVFRWQQWGPDQISAQDGGPVIAACRPDLFIFQWQPDNASYFTTVECKLFPAEEGTILELRETGYHNTSEGRQAMLNCATGWGEALTLLKMYLEHGVRY